MFNQTFGNYPKQSDYNDTDEAITDDTLKQLEDNINNQLKKQQQISNQMNEKKSRLKSAIICRSQIPSINQQSNRILPSAKMPSAKIQKIYIPALYGINQIASNLATIGNYQIQGNLGQGSYATVKLAINNQTHERVALKIYEKSKLNNPCKRLNIQREIEILSILSHKNTIKLVEIVDDQKQLILSIEYATGISLNKYLELQPGKCLPESPETKFIIRQIVEGVIYFHSKNIVHRDLKLDNILFDLKAQSLKIIDFGFSIKAHPEKRLQIFCGTPKYMAPEIILKRQYYGQFVDSWALGIIIFVLLSGDFPFKGKNESELFKEIISGKYSFTKELSNNAQLLISNILKLNPVERLTAKEILDQQWFLE